MLAAPLKSVGRVGVGESGETGDAKLQVVEKARTAHLFGRSKRLMLYRDIGTRTPNSGARNRCVANYTISLLCRSQADLERREYTLTTRYCQAIFGKKSVLRLKNAHFTAAAGVLIA